jgi:hypothetical protein
VRSAAASWRLSAIRCVLVLELQLRATERAAHSSLTAAVCGPSTLRYLLLLLLLLSVVFVLLRELVTRTASICSTPVHRGSVLFSAVLSF